MYILYFMKQLIISIILTLYPNLEGDCSTISCHVVSDYAGHEFWILRAPDGQTSAKLLATEIELVVYRKPEIMAGLRVKPAAGLNTVDRKRWL